jgi:hypothetical protein
MWIVAGLVIVAIVVALIGRRRRRNLDMGTMSDQWMAERRVSQGSDPNR